MSRVQSIDTVLQIIDRRIDAARKRWKERYMPQDDGAYDELCELFEEIEGDDDTE